jgi:peptidoglycan/LPS O-acetylase OafA/YrhL
MPPPTYYYGIDAVRLSCALMVAVFHLLFWSWAGAYSTIDQTNHIFAQAAQFEPVVGFTWYGWVGVEIFFVISGLVISNSASGASPLEFLKGRALRLYPSAWICATCTLVALLAIAGDPISVVIGPYLKSMLLFPKGPWIDAVYWTLSVEIAFYALIFLVLLTKTFALVHRVAWCLTFCSGIFNGIHLIVQLGALSSPLYSAMLAWHPTLLLLLPHGCRRRHQSTSNLEGDEWFHGGAARSQRAGGVLLVFLLGDRARHSQQIAAKYRSARAKGIAAATGSHFPIYQIITSAAGQHYYALMPPHGRETQT